MGNTKAGRRGQGPETLSQWTEAADGGSREKGVQGPGQEHVQPPAVQQGHLATLGAKLSGRGKKQRGPEGLCLAEWPGLSRGKGSRQDRGRHHSQPDLARVAAMGSRRGRSRSGSRWMSVSVVQREPSGLDTQMFRERGGSKGDKKKESEPGAPRVPHVGSRLLSCTDGCPGAASEC